MPKTDVNDNRAMHNLQGIDLRKNADSNSAEDMVNVWINSEHRFTNRPMPSLYTANEVTYNGSYKFACECKNLAGNEVEIDITSAEAKPVLHGEATDNQTGEIWITGSNLETVRTILWLDRDNGGVLASGVDFSFYYDRKNDRIAVVLKEDMDYSSFDYFVLISPYGMVSTEILGMVPDYYFGPCGEYRVRTYSQNGVPILSFEAKNSNGSYTQMQVWKDSDVKIQDATKHRMVEGVERLWFSNHHGCIVFNDDDPDNPVLKVQYYNGAMTDAFEISGGKSVGEELPSMQDVTFDEALKLGKGDAFQLVGANNSLDIQIKTDDTYTTLASF